MVEPRQPTAGGATEPLRLAPDATRILLTGGTEIDLLRPAPGSARLWLAAVVGDDVLTASLHAHGRAIRYRYVDRDWPLEAYQTVFADKPGSAEMPSAARPFSDALVTALIRRGIALAPITLHTGVSSLEGHELPYPERFEVPSATAAAVNAVHAAGGHVIAVGTTVVRALETAVDRGGTVHPAEGWTDTVITPERGVRAVDGLITGWHEPEATHLMMLEAVAGRAALVDAYAEAFAAGYLWHEFGDSHLLLPYAGAR
jgi:S-adenosylmethionine:tRNA ribosyltransferase-isomerase